MSFEKWKKVVSLVDLKVMKTRNDCEIACYCVKQANVVLHVGLCKEIFARKHTATHKPTSAQPLYSYQRDRGQESWLGRGHRISQHTCTCCTIMLHASCADAEVAFEYMHVECTAWIGDVVSLRLCTSKIFSSCALQTFLIPLTHNLAKCPHQLFLPFLDRLRRHRCLRSSIPQRRSPELHAKRRDSQACSDFAQSTDKAALRAFSREEFCSRAESWSCGRTFDRQT